MKKYRHEIEVFTLTIFSGFFQLIGIKNIFIATIILALLKLLFVIIIKSLAKVEKEINTDINTFVNNSYGIIYLLFSGFLFYLFFKGDFYENFMSFISQDNDCIFCDKDNSKPIFDTNSIILFLKLITISFGVFSFLLSIINFKRK